MSDKVKGINKNGDVVELQGDEWEKRLERLRAEKEADKPIKKVKRLPAVRVRRFSLSSYISYGHLLVWLKQQQWIQHWAVAYHDKDLKEDGTPKEPHTHILLYTYDGKTSTAILKIFDRFSKQLYSGTDTPPQNTLCEVLQDVVYMWRYLLHLDDPDKYQYPATTRVCDNFAYWHKIELTQGLTQSSTNSGLAVFEDILSGTSTYDLIRRYGKDYIYHNHQYKAVVSDFNREEYNKMYCDRPLKIEECFPFLLANAPFNKETLKAFWIVMDYVKAECRLSYDSKLTFYLEEKKTNET